MTGINSASHLELDRLLAIMARLRDPELGCEWDCAQTFATVAPYTIEEAYEVADAIARNDLGALREELGDLLLQVVFHARMAEEAGAFGFADVARTVAAKLEGRHPHIFGQETPVAASSERWEAIKAAERSANGVIGVLDGVALALPALMRAEKLQKRAARVGFDWPDTDGPRAKVAEEMDELRDAADADERSMEAGDLLFAAVNLVRAYGVEPEEALRHANAKFERRFQTMEFMATSDQKDFASLNLTEQESYWQAAKALERGEPT